MFEGVDEPPAYPLPFLTWCDWHGGYTGTGRIVGVEEQCSGPGICRYACAECRAKHGLTPWAERPGP